MRVFHTKYTFRRVWINEYLDIVNVLRYHILKISIGCLFIFSVFMVIYDRLSRGGAFVFKSAWSYSSRLSKDWGCQLDVCDSATRSGWLCSFSSKESVEAFFLSPTVYCGEFADLIRTRPSLLVKSAVSENFFYFAFIIASLLAATEKLDKKKDFI